GRLQARRVRAHPHLQGSRGKDHQEVRREVMAGNMNKKVERIAEKRDNRPYATAKYIRISPYKVRTVLALIRGKSVEEAEAILTYCNKGGSEEVKKVLL